MTLSEMQSLLSSLVDDSVNITFATSLLNMGQNQMAMEVKATFPQLVVTETNGTFVFPVKYHDLAVIYAAAMFKAFDSAVRESQNYMNQFLQRLPDFSENYNPPARYWDDFNVQQYTADGVTNDFLITKEGYDRKNSSIRVYVNDVLVPATASTADNTFSVDSDTTLVADDCVTIKWVVDTSLSSAPYSWWEGMP